MVALIIVFSIALIFGISFLFWKISSTTQRKKEEFVYPFQNNSDEYSSNYVRTPVRNFNPPENFNLGSKQKLALSENICLFFADEKDLIIKASEERVKLSSRESEKVLVISSLLSFPKIPNLTHFETENFLWKYSDSYFKFDFDSVVFCCEYPYNRLRKFIKEAIRSCDKVFLSTINKTEIIIEDFKKIGKEFVLINFKKPYLGGIKKFEKTIKNLTEEITISEEAWTKRKYKPKRPITQEQTPEILKKTPEIIVLPQKIERIAEVKPVKKEEIYVEILQTKPKSEVIFFENIRIYVSGKKEQSLKEKTEDLLKDNKEFKILFVTYHTSKFTELFSDLLTNKKLNIINPLILKNLKGKEASILDHKIVCFDEFYIDAKGTFFGILKLLLENHKKIFGVVSKKEFNSEAGIKFKKDFPNLVEALFEKGESFEEEEIYDED